MQDYSTFDLTGVDPKIIQTNKRVSYVNVECAFDIETTNATYNGEKLAFMYCWQWGIQDKEHIYLGRTWEQFIDLCKQLQQRFDLSESKRIICYVHNLGFEFQFMRKYFEWVNVFAVDERKPIKALCSYGIEFRDSYILSGYSLAKTAENLTAHKIEKLVGDLDYTLIRNSKTELTEEEKAYCNNDIEILLYYINEQIAMYGDISKIPLTNTGRVRQFVRNRCYHTSTNHKKDNRGHYMRYRRIMNDLQLSANEYTMLKRAFAGGFTHANANYSGKVLENVASIDFTSSYPAVMLSEKFPMSRGFVTELTPEKDFEYYLQNYCLVFDVIFEGLESTVFFDHYISESKCIRISNPIIDNGRVYSADMVAMTITDVDYKIIRKCYKWKTCKVAHIIRYAKGYLPKPIIQSIIELYGKKTTLKGVEGKETEYLLSKSMLNSVYGMCVTDIVRDNSVYQDGEWGKEKADPVEDIKKYNESKSRFLYYPWGVWVTAYARANLWMGILNIGEDYVYSDTDSVKFLHYDAHKGFIEWYNTLITRKLQIMCDELKIDFEALQPKTKKGVKKPMGVWDFEGIYTRFKTLGAKRYLVEHDGKLQLTVAGLSKQNGIAYMIEQQNGDFAKVFEMFNDELYIDGAHTGKMTHTYIDDEQEGLITDYQGNTEHVISKSCVFLEDCEFTLSLSEQYAKFLGMLQKGFIFRGVKYE